MLNEQEPKEYKFKHPRRISIDSYNGVAGGGIMELNNPIADGFMRVSDMRSDVVIMKKPQDRIRDYDDIGFVKVADDVWYIAVNDQDLADKVARQAGDDRKFDERFVDAFQ